VVALQGWHAVEPLASLKVPSGQGSQTPPAALRKLPGAHGSQLRSVTFVGGATSCSPSSHVLMGQHTRSRPSVGGAHWKKPRVALHTWAEEHRTCCVALHASLAN
jgi:hypothetical protein